MKTYTREEFYDEIAELPDESKVLIERWLTRGDGVAVYEAMAFDRSDFGQRKYVSYGSSAAQLEIEVAGDLPTRLPDNLPAGAINWQYQLVGTWREDSP